MIQYLTMSKEQTHPLHATDKNIIDSLIIKEKPEDIDFINQEVKTGLFYIDFKNKNIVYENKFLINIPILNQQLEETFLPHLNNMRAFTLALKERYNLNKICK